MFDKHWLKLPDTMRDLVDEICEARPRQILDDLNGVAGPRFSIWDAGSMTPNLRKAHRVFIRHRRTHTPLPSRLQATAEDPRQPVMLFDTPGWQNFPPSTSVDLSSDLASSSRNPTPSTQSFAYSGQPISGGLTPDTLQTAFGAAPVFEQNTPPVFEPMPTPTHQPVQPEMPPQFTGQIPRTSAGAEIRPIVKLLKHMEALLSRTSQPWQPPVHDSSRSSYSSILPNERSYFDRADQTSTERAGFSHQGTRTGNSKGKAPVIIDGKVDWQHVFSTDHATRERDLTIRELKVQVLKLQSQLAQSTDRMAARDGPKATSPSSPMHSTAGSDGVLVSTPVMSDDE